MTSAKAITPILGVPSAADFVLLALRCRTDERREWCADTGRTYFDPDLCARSLIRNDGPAWLLMSPEGEPWIAAGLEPVRPGVYRAWAVGTHEGWDAGWRSITKQGRRMLREALQQGARRIEIVSLADREETHRWYETVGFRLEGRLRRHFTDGSDAVIHAITRED